VLWSYPQSSQNLLPPARGAPQLGQGGAAAAAGVAAGAGVAEADGGGTEIVPVPPILAPHSSQKSSVLDVCPFGQV
jgi:hypothetical protein